MTGYNVIDNVSHSSNIVAYADVVIAFCGSQFFTIKDRNAEPTAPFGIVPSKPDLVIAYCRHPASVTVLNLQ